MTFIAAFLKLIITLIATTLFLFTCAWAISRLGSIPLVVLIVLVSLFATLAFIRPLLGRFGLHSFWGAIL